MFGPDRVKDLPADPPQDAGFCQHCGKWGGLIALDNGAEYCHNCHPEAEKAPECEQCGHRIFEDEGMTVNGKKYHFACVPDDAQFTSEGET